MCSPTTKFVAASSLQEPLRSFSDSDTSKLMNELPSGTLISSDILYHSYFMQLLVIMNNNFCVHSLSQANTWMNCLPA